MPVSEWLRGPLRDWAIDLLSPRMVRDDGYLDPGPIQVCLKEHLDGTRDWGAYLWDVLVFQAWLHDAGQSGPGSERAGNKGISNGSGSALAESTGA